MLAFGVKNFNRTIRNLMLVTLLNDSNKKTARSSFLLQAAYIKQTINLYEIKIALKISGYFQPPPNALYSVMVAESFLYFMSIRFSSLFSALALAVSTSR